ncbi:MAG: DNA polymerase beta domain-containing protein [bacterium]|nr:MAG: DNA polymerase beta domain-containing protein [bacterium]
MATVGIQEQIKEICKKIVNKFHPEKIILFGSYAYGEPNQYSDVDLFVVMPFKGSSLSQVAKIITRTKPDFALDLIVCTPEQLKEKLAIHDRFIQTIVQKGKIAYEAKHD